MPRLAIKRNWGEEDFKDNPRLVRQLDDMYTDISTVVETSSKVRSTEAEDPPANSEANRNYNIGDIAVRKDTNTAWIMTSRANANEVTWTQVT